MISSFVRARPLARPQIQDTKLLIYDLFQKGRVLAQDELGLIPPGLELTIAMDIPQAGSSRETRAHLTTPACLSIGEPHRKVLASSHQH